MTLPLGGLSLVVAVDLAFAIGAGFAIAAVLLRIPALRCWWAEAGLLLGFAMVLGSVLGFFGAFALGGTMGDLLHPPYGESSAEFALSSNGPWLVGLLMGTFAGNVAVGVASVRLGDRPLGGRPALRWWGIVPALSVALLVVAFGWGSALEWMGYSVENQVLAESLVSQLGWVRTALLVYAVVLAPLSEELMFRGWLQTLLTRRFGKRLAIVGQALPFAAMHTDRLWVIPLILLIGVAAGWLRARSGSLAPGVALHAINNALAAIP